MRSWSLLNTDQTPAAFWITHPDNIFRRNHAAGSDRYGFWFDTQTHSMGPSFSLDICPENSRLGEFTDNVAHSVGRYGLRIFHNLNPREFPCQAISDDNPTVPAYFDNFFGYRCGRNGIIASFVGDVKIRNATVVDNILAGIEFEKTLVEEHNKTEVIGGRVIAHSNSPDFDTSSVLNATLLGIIAPRTDWLHINGPKFYRYSGSLHGALSTCSHCFHGAATDSGARTIFTEGLSFDTDSSSHRIHY